MDRETRVESSVPVQGRVSIVTLAELGIYWESLGADIRTMSQLLSWSVDALREILATNGKLPQVVESVADAHRYLEENKLYQTGLKQRSIRKIVNAMAFENLRVEGIDPKQYVPQHYNAVHNQHSVKPIESQVKKSQEEVRAKWRREEMEKKMNGGREEVKGNVTSDEEWEEMQERIREEKEKERKESMRKAVESARDGGFLVIAEEPTVEDGGEKEVAGKGFRAGMSEEELNEYNRKREEEVRKRENAPVDVEFLKSMLIK
jgi:hypothetical protein